jgi:hypothetical protein
MHGKGKHYMPDANPNADKLIGLLRGTLEQKTFVKLVLGKYRGDEKELERVVIKRVTVKDLECLSFVYSYETKDITKNAEIPAAIEIVRGLLGDAFRRAHLFSLTETIQVAISKRGKGKWGTSKPSCDALPSEQHDNEKERLIDPTSRFLKALKITDAKDRVRPSMSRKWKQINKFLEVFQGAYASSQLSEKKEVRVVDFGSGKGYLTFAVHDYLKSGLKTLPYVTGVEIRDGLVRLCDSIARKLGAHGLSFCQGDISSYEPGSIDIMIALHACDTATDEAISMGVDAGAEIIMCAPCCHKEIRKQIKSPDLLRPMLKYGIHLGDEAEMVTDSLRALLLEAKGYKVQIFEFTSLEHTAKNKMLLAVKHSKPVEHDAIMDQIAKLKDFYSIKTQALEGMLSKPTKQ